MAVISYLALSLQNLREALRRIWQGPGSKLFAFVLPEDCFAGRHIKETPQYQHVHVANEVPSHTLYVLSSHKQSPTLEPKDRDCLVGSDRNVSTHSWPRTHSDSERHM